MRGLKLIALAVVVFTLGAIVAANWVTLSAGQRSPAQDVRSLESRLNMMEQRLYSMQTSINRLEQTAAFQRSTPTDTGRGDINLLAEEVRNLRQRLNEVECGVLKLDERTGVKHAKVSDPCRANTMTPIQLPSRP